MDLDKLFNLLTIYRSKYLFKKNDHWIACDKFLNDGLLKRNISSEESNVSWYACHTSNFFAVDIDNHSGDVDLQAVYKRVIDVFSTPSLVNKSPQGLHLYFCFKERVSIELIALTVRGMLKGLPIEVLPTAVSGLRVPNNLIDPATFEQKDFSEALDEAIVYNFSELFPEGLRSLGFSTTPSTENYETIYAGETNDALCNLIPQFKSKGMDEQSCTQEYMSRLSPSYEGEMKSERRVAKRVHSFFKRDITSPFASNASQDEDIYNRHKSIIDGLISTVIKRNSSLTDHNLLLKVANTKAVLCQIYKQVERTEIIKNNPAILARYSSMYKFFRHEVKKGNFALPTVQLAATCPGYRSVLTFLLDVGFLNKPNGNSYCPGSCIYYNIDEKYNYRQYSIPYIVSDVLDKAVLRVRRQIKRERPVLINICYNMFNHLTEEKASAYINPRLCLSG